MRAVYDSQCLIYYSRAGCQEAASIYYRIGWCPQDSFGSVLRIIGTKEVGLGLRLHLADKNDLQGVRRRVFVVEQVLVHRWSSQPP